MSDERTGQPPLMLRHVKWMRSLEQDGKKLCWFILEDAGTVGVTCIRDRGHDNGVHEPPEPEPEPSALEAAEAAFRTALATLGTSPITYAAYRAVTLALAEELHSEHHGRYASCYASLCPLAAIIAKLKDGAE